MKSTVQYSDRVPGAGDYNMAAAIRTRNLDSGLHTGVEVSSPSRELTQNVSSLFRSRNLTSSPRTSVEFYHRKLWKGNEVITPLSVNTSAGPFSSCDLMLSCVRKAECCNLAYCLKENLTLGSEYALSAR